MRFDEFWQENKDRFGGDASPHDVARAAWEAAINAALAVVRQVEDRSHRWYDDPSLIESELPAKVQDLMG